MSAYMNNDFVGIDLNQQVTSTKPAENNTTRQLPFFYAIALQCWSDFVLAIVFAVIWIVISEENPRIRPIRPWDATLSYPATTKDTVPGWTCIVVPLVCLVLTVTACEWVAALRTRGNRTAGTFLTRLIHFIMQGLYAYVFAMMACEAIKDAVGQPRPQFLSRCQPTPSSAAFPNALTANALEQTVVCTNTDKSYMADARRSFPSGHSCSNAVMSAYIISYLISLMSGIKDVPTGGLTWRDAGRDMLQTLGLLWALAVFSWPWFVACTRIIDNMHATADVTAGLFLGVIVGVLYGTRAVQRVGGMLRRLAATTTLQ